MFDYTLIHWVTFLGAAVALTLSPGPDMAYIIARTTLHGRRSGFAACAGTWIGALFHVLTAAFGLTALLAVSSAAFTSVKWVGAAYLVWLGVSALRSSLSGRKMTPASLHSERLTRSFSEGVVVAILNPKAALFFLAFLPQFVVDGAGPVSAQLALHGLLIILVAVALEPLIVLAADGLARFVRRDPIALRWIERVVGVIFIFLGLRLAAFER